MSCAEPQLPVLDLSALRLQLGEVHPDIQLLCNEIKEGSEQWGCFRVVNHGVEQELIQSMDLACRDLFNLPAEAKQRAVSPRLFDGYTKSTNYTLCESIVFPAIDNLQHYAEKLWPQGNPKFCDILGAYCSKLEGLRNSITKLILQGLGLQAVTKHFQDNFEKCESKLRLNYCSPCGESSDDIYMKAHKEIGIMSILYEDTVGGFEIKSKQGQWYTLKPLVGSFLVILGDALKTWSNDRCWSVEHRVVYERKKPRLSIILLSGFLPEFEVCMPEELIDNEHPRIYKSFLFKDYVKSKARELNILVGFRRYVLTFCM